MIALVDLIVQFPELRVVKILDYEVYEFGECGCPCGPALILG